MKLSNLATYAAAIVVAYFSASTSAMGQGRSLESVAEENNKKLAAPWTTLRPGQGDKSGFSLSRNGTLSYSGKPFQPKVEVSDSKGKPSNYPSAVKISPISPSGRYALLTGCENEESPSNLCWFQYLVDIQNGKLHKASWAKYPSPVYVWWAKDESFAVVPISDEGETWLSALDINKPESIDIHFYESVLAASRLLQCKPSEDEYAVDLASLNWVKNNEISLSIAIKCGVPSRLQALAGTVKLDTGTIKLIPAGAPQQADAGASQSPSPGFDCKKATSAVERTICADANLAKLDSHLMTLYQQAMKQAGSSDALKAQQLAWLRQVRNPCASVACLAGAYQKRIAELQSGGAAPISSWSPSPFPATYRGGFTGKEKLTFTADGRVLEEGASAGTYQADLDSPWADAKYPVVLIQQEGGKILKTHCKVQPDMRKLHCNHGGTASSEYDRIDPLPAIKLPVAKKCDDEQLYLDVMAAARKARPNLELKGATDIRLSAEGKCLISLYYLRNGEAIDLNATYDLNGRPVNLIFINKH